MQDRLDVIARAIDAYQALAELAESIEDEWQYVTDLVDAYEPVIETLGASNASGTAETFTASQAEAVDELIAEIGLITDPHKAIDWLSTFPNVLALILEVKAGAPGRSQK